MANSPRLLSDFCGIGPLVSRPATPNVNNGELSMWYDTTNNQLTIYNYTIPGWVVYSPQSAAPTIVQSVAGNLAGVASLTLGAAPANGNVLVCIFASSNLPGPGTGWLQLNNNGLGLDFIGANIKICGAGESATQTFVSGNITQGTGHMWEIKPASPGFYYAAHGTGTSLADAATSAGTGLMLGAFENVTDTVAPTSITNGTLDQAATGTNRQIQGFHASQNPGSTTYTVNYAASKSIVGMIVECH